LEVDRTDPENRPFKHPDPIGWTEDNRGKILAALYTILLGNPRLHDPHAVPPETRFKDWYHLIGSAVESAARACGEAVRFRDLFLAQEEDDEESASLADALAVLAATWPNQTQFPAAHVANLINTASQTEHEGGMTLREFLFPEVSQTLAVSAKATAKRLKRYLGEPVPNNDKTLILREIPDTHSKITSYYVVVK
jgi:hypothetical protein